MYKNEFGIILDTSGYDAERVAPNGYPCTYAGIRKWIEDNYNFKITNSSITKVRNKCNASKIDFEAGTEPAADVIKTEKEKIVLEAFKAFGIV